MVIYISLLLALVYEVSANYRPLEESPCITTKMVALCQNRSLQQVPLALHPGIKALNLSNNDLQNITRSPLSFYSLTEILDLSNNKISFIQPDTFKNMVHLKEINLSNNYLDRFAFYSLPGIGLLPNVQKLDLSGNSLYTDFTGYFLENAPNLRYLSLAGNSITMISPETFSGTPHLEELDLRNNIILDIEEGSFENLTHLTKIDMVMNSITCISQFNLRQLQTLNLSKNSINIFHTSHSEEEYNLKYVDLSDNKLGSFPVFPINNNIVSLNLCMNLISFGGTKTSHEEFDWIEDEDLRNVGMVDLLKLTHLDLSYNNLKSLPEEFFLKMPSLQFLNLSRNCLESVTFVDSVKLNYLEYLDLSHNSLHNISLASGSLPSLRVLDLQNNELQAVESLIFQGLSSITTINLQSNRVGLCGMYFKETNHIPEKDGCISFFNIPTLEHLNLRDNMLEVVPQYAFSGTPLIFLDLSMNLGLTIKMHALKGLESSLEVLHVEDNYLLHLNVDLPLLAQLRYLNLSGNQLTWLPSWNKNSHMETLDLSNNSFSNLKDSNIPALENTLKTLSLHGNPLGCCANSWVIHMVRRNTVAIKDLEVTTCQNSNGQTEEILLGQNNSDTCESDDLKNMNTVIILTAVVAVLVTTVGVVSLGYYCRHKLNQRFKA